LIASGLTGVDGIEAARRIRALGPGPGDVPMIALTADVMPRSLESYQEAGFTGHMAKPINAEALMDLMDTFAEGARRDEEVERQHEARKVALCEGPRVSSKVDTQSR
jgi:CheY-like chemotaxis protein